MAKVGKYASNIKMYFSQSEHNPPHFHVIYGEYAGLIHIENLYLIIEGDLPSKALSLVLELAKIYQNELMLIWNTQNFVKLPPLE